MVNKRGLPKSSSENPVSLLAEFGAAPKTCLARFWLHHHGAGWPQELSEPVRRAETAHVLAVLTTARCASHHLGRRLERFHHPMNPCDEAANPSTVAPA